MDLVQRTFKVCDEALQQANMIARDLGGVILVGGSTRLPVVRQAVSEYFQQEPRADVDPDEVVAMGAAIHAASLCSTEEQDSFLLDVTPLSLRIGVAGGLAETVIERNTPVPIEQTRTFTTYQDFQESVKIRVFQGESRQAKENEMLGQFEFSGFKKARRGEVRIDVTFEINSDGIVNVTACDQETEQQASTQITLSSGLSEQEISQIIDEGRTERVRSSGTVDGDSQASAAASSPAPSLEEEPSDELELLPDAADLLEETSDLEIDDEGEATALGAEAEEEDRDPNAATQPDREPLAVTAPPENVAEVEFEATELEATEAENLEEMQPPGSVDGIPVDELDGSPDDEIQIQSGAESLFEKAGADLSQYDDESER
jgi:molecular chaperone DnaK (HSP70)